MGVLKKMLKYVALTMLGIALYSFASDVALVHRGYHAYGGEVGLLFLPLVYAGVSGMIRDYRAMHEELESSEDDE